LQLVKVTAGHVAIWAEQAPFKFQASALAEMERNRKRRRRLAAGSEYSWM
jgi:hypothetical protein